jgi:hypothetical protein
VKLVYRIHTSVIYSNPFPIPSHTDSLWEIVLATFVTNNKVPVTVANTGDKYCTIVPYIEVHSILLEGLVFLPTPITVAMNTKNVFFKSVVKW